MSPKKEKFTMTIPSDPEQIQVVEQKAEKLSKKIPFTPDERDSLAIAITEVVANAIFHGNREAKDKKIFITFIVDDTSLEVRVRDQGGGFQLDQVANPLHPENLLKDSGRGIFIIRTLMDKIEYKFHKDGTEVIMVKSHDPSSEN